MQTKLTSTRVNVQVAESQGEAELAIFLNHYLVEAEGIDYAGPYPGDLQSYIAFSAGLSAKSSNAEAATAFIKFLSAPAAAPGHATSAGPPAAGGPRRP